MLHLLFEFLAFKSDISFWQGNKSLVGLSAQAVVSELFSQIIIFLFLVDSCTSLLVTIPAFFGILIQAWKVKRATGIVLNFAYPFVRFTRWETESSTTKTDTGMNIEISCKFLKFFFIIDVPISRLKIENFSIFKRTRKSVFRG